MSELWIVEYILHGTRHEIETYAPSAAMAWAKIVYSIAYSIDCVPTLNCVRNAYSGKVCL